MPSPVTKSVEQVVAETTRQLVWALEAELELALKAYTDERNTEKYRTRVAAIVGLKALLRFLEKLRFEYQLVEPLVTLCAALEDAAQGIGNPILEPEPYKADGSRIGTYEALVWTRAVPIVDFLKESGVDLHIALARVAQVASSALGKTITTREFGDLRKRMRAGRMSQDVLREYRRHEAAQRAFGAAKKIPMDKLAELALADLAQKARPKKVLWPPS
jgi:hypothetical protein